MAGGVRRGLVCGLLVVALRLVGRLMWRHPADRAMKLVAPQAPVSALNTIAAVTEQMIATLRGEDDLTNVELRVVKYGPVCWRLADEDGLLLPGEWPTPVDAYSARLKVLEQLRAVGEV